MELITTKYAKYTNTNGRNQFINYLQINIKWIPTPGPPTISATATETAWRTVGRKLSIQTIESEFVKAVLLKYLPPPAPPPCPQGRYKQRHPERQMTVTIKVSGHHVSYGLVREGERSRVFTSAAVDANDVGNTPAPHECSWLSGSISVTVAEL